MPVIIENLESQVEVEPTAAQGPVEQRDDDAVKALQRWQEMARTLARREARTAAWGFDD